MLATISRSHHCVIKLRRGLGRGMSDGQLCGYVRRVTAAEKVRIYRHDRVSDGLVVRLRVLSVL